MPKISVLMPAYNAEAYLREAIDSILAQTYTDFECIVINDGSSDSTEEIVLSYRDPRIVYLKNEQNAGIVLTLNKGLAAAKGEYIARMDADDISLPDRFAEQVAFMDGHPDVAVCGTDIEMFGARIGAFTHATDSRALKIDLLIASSLAHPTVMMRGAWFGADGYEYDPAFNGMEDYELWYRVSKEHPIANIGKVLLKYRMHPGQTTRNYSERHRAMATAFKKRQWIDLGLDAEDEAFGVYVRYCDKSQTLSKDEMPAFLKVWDAIEKANAVTKIYEEKSLHALLETIKRSALNGFPIGQAAALIPVPGDKLRYVLQRTARGIVGRIRTKRRIRRNLRRLKNRDFTIISNNCWGGIVSEKYGLQKRSPTCGLLIYGEDYIKFCWDLRHYIQEKLEFIPYGQAKYGYVFPGASFPVARLGDIEVYFKHYKSEEIAAAKWYRRCERIHWENIVYKISQRETFDKKTLEEFMALPLKNKLCFSYDDIPGAVVIPPLRTLEGDETALIGRFFDEARYLNRIKEEK